MLLNNVRTHKVLRFHVVMLLAFLGEIRTDQYYTIDNFPTIFL